MGSKDNSPISRSQLLLGLNGLAFVIITAGVGLMQAFYAARGVQATNGPGLTRVDYAIIATQANILFPLGQLLLILGLAIVTSTLFQSVFYWKPWIEQAKKTRRRSWIVLGVGTLVSLYFLSFRGSTYVSLAGDFALHAHALWVFGFLSMWFTFALRKALEIIAKGKPH